MCVYVCMWECMCIYVYVCVCLRMSVYYIYLIYTDNRMHGSLGIVSKK